MTGRPAVRRRRNTLILLDPCRFGAVDGQGRTYRCDRYAAHPGKHFLRLAGHRLPPAEARRLKER